MEQIREQVQVTAENIVALSEKNKAVRDVISTVNDIAERTNLLALNAAIEAASAGNSGARFSVVAEELKGLADQAKTATGEVRSILEDIEERIHRSVMFTEEAVKRVERGRHEAGNAEETISELNSSTVDSVRAFQQIVASAGQQQIDSKCIDCVAGQFSVAKSGGSSISCEKCVQGYYQDQAGTPYCLPCIPGQFNDAAGAVICKDCRINSFSTSKNRKVPCDACAEGRTSVNGSTKCSDCAAGKIINLVTNGCTDCLKGEYRSGTDDNTVCLKCLAGFYTDDVGQGSCLPCIPGEFNDITGAVICKSCRENSYSIEKNRKSPCDDCAQGRTSEKGSVECLVECSSCPTCTCTTTSSDTNPVTTPIKTPSPSPKTPSGNVSNGSNSSGPSGSHSSDNSPIVLPVIISLLCGIFAGAAGVVLVMYVSKLQKHGARKGDMTDGGDNDNDKSNNSTKVTPISAQPPPPPILGKNKEEQSEKLRDVRKQYGAGSDEYKTAARNVQH